MKIAFYSSLVSHLYLLISITMMIDDSNKDYYTFLDLERSAESFNSSFDLEPPPVGWEGARTCLRSGFEFKNLVFHMFLCAMKSID